MARDANLKYDFSGWATRNNLKCSDGRTIMKDAFKHNDGAKVPLVWNHKHDKPDNVLGHAILKNMESGVYAYCSFNDTDSAKDAKELVKHSDIVALSIYANKLKQNGNNVLHGEIKEVSLVTAGANPGAFIDSVMCHGEENEYVSEDEAVIYTGFGISLQHADPPPVEEPKEEETGDKETIQQIYDSMSEKQKKVVDILVAEAVETAVEEEPAEHNDKDSDGGEETVKYNLFDRDDEEDNPNVIKHADMMAAIADGKRYGSLRESALQHGIDNVDYLFPDARTMQDAPDFIQRPTEWVSKFMSAAHHTPFSRIKSMHADITEDDARAKGYIKGNLKKEEVFSLLKRTTGPTTVYKKQKMERDDVADIVDFDVVAWLKTEMRGMLDEEIARAGLVGDGRLASSEDKINEQCIRPVWTDGDLYTVKTLVTTAANPAEGVVAKTFIKAAIRARKSYKGSGSPTLYTTEDIITECLLLTDETGRDLYDSVDKLATKLRVKEIVAVPVMEGLTRVHATAGTVTLLGIIINPTDYNFGADKGGSVNMFEDFDIDFNAMKYLIETRCSGALTKPFSALVFEHAETAG